MPTILETCQPRADLLKGSFNSEIFTASLSQVIEHYRSEIREADTIYKDPIQFFSDATYPTHGLKDVVLTVFKRLSGDNAIQAIRKLETSFGGGKTHTLIALTHLAYRGTDLMEVTKEIIPPEILPAPGDIRVVGIAGDRLPVQKTSGLRLIPYTLWGEIAFQIGGDALYHDVKNSADSFAAPGEDYFDTVFKGRKVLIMLDELAQYATRFQAAQPDGGDQLAAFLMRLHGYARDHSGIAVVLTLAGSTDAFAKQTKKIAAIISEVKGGEVDESQALAMAQDAQRDIKSVVSRDAVTAIPVHAKELTNVLSKRLFSHIDTALAEKTVNAYVEMYKLHALALPDKAVHDAFHQDLRANYPFHPNFIRFLNGKLATVENFQGTRGVLRTLALVVRNIWEKKRPLPMIHTCHIDLQDPYIVSELVGRTEGGALLPVLNADVGGPDTSTLSIGSSHAQQADRRNPHPMGFPLHEYTWRTIFLHSLVGRSEGIRSNLFGILKQEALFSVSFPDMTPPQVETALKEIETSAMYLKESHGKYYASLEPTINKPLMDIQSSLRGSDGVNAEIAAVARKVLDKKDAAFRVVQDITSPEEVPDEGNKPIISLVALTAETIDAVDFVTTCGEQKPRQRQNLVFLLVPKTVKEASEAWSEMRKKAASETMERIETLCLTVMAMTILKRDPENYGIKPEKLAQNNFDQRLKERQNALSTIVTQSYNSLWFSSASGQFIRKEIVTAGGEGGASVIEQIKKTLAAEGELITKEAALSLETLTGLSHFFFGKNETPSIESIRSNFSVKRDWPILEDISQLDAIIREGVKRGKWCLFRMDGMESMQPDHFFCNETGMVPLDVNLEEEGWTLVLSHGAKKRGWWPSKIDKKKIESTLKEVFKNQEAVTLEGLCKAACQSYGDLPEESIVEIAETMVKNGMVGAYTGSIDQNEAPGDLTLGGGPGKPFMLKPGQIVATPAFIAKKGWQSKRSPNESATSWQNELPDKTTIKLSGKEGAKKIYSLLNRMGGLFSKGATSTIDVLELMVLEIPGGGRMTITLEDVSPSAVKHLDEFLENLKNAVEIGEETEGYLEINDVDDTCLLVKNLNET